jgi:succinate-semialdehyde dehydrogenase/glutarate-semialdehyde dehydrogenase
MGSLVSKRQLDTVTRHVEEAVKNGATVLAGGRPRPDVGPLFYEPTILDGVDESSAVCAEETFGPVVSVYRFATEDEAIERANATPYGLNSSVWTKDTRRGRAVAARLRTGTVNVNEGYAPAYGSAAAPMGGMKQSGIGRRHGAEGILKYTDVQTVAIQRVIGFGPSFGMTDEQHAAFLARSLKAMRALRLK